MQRTLKDPLNNLVLTVSRMCNLGVGGVLWLRRILRNPSDTSGRLRGCCSKDWLIWRGIARMSSDCSICRDSWDWRGMALSAFQRRRKVPWCRSEGFGGYRRQSGNDGRHGVVGLMEGGQGKQLVLEFHKALLYQRCSQVVGSKRLRFCTEKLRRGWATHLGAPMLQIPCSDTILHRR